MPSKLKLALVHNGRDLAVQIFPGPLVERVEELLGQISGRLPLLKILELQGLADAILEDERDKVRIDRRSP